jgi:hypothetical protein
MKIAKASSNARNVWGILMPISDANLTKLQGLQVAVYVDFITTGDRPRLLSGQSTIDDILSHYTPSQQVALQNYKTSFTNKWADASAPTVAKYYAGNLDVNTEEHSRLTAWVTSQTPEPIWIRCIWEGLNDDDFDLNSFSTGLTGLPPVGTTLPIGTNMSDLLNMAGFVAWTDQGPID